MEVKNISMIFYYFASKEQMLEEVIKMMLDSYTEKATEILNSTLSLPEKAIGITTSFQPNVDELPIVHTLNHKDNLIMHNKVNKKVLERIVPILSRLCKEEFN